ncbi:hypothetical protein FV227_26770 [Methylobacterium sp. WL119]|uniref:hypothetical protein n=1 Tax=unclassified Methylobacterium TaxID=2615210 RepID=UPI0011C86707|nr:MULTISPECIES: hypothetical protein [unclassified Methylobacterium]TXN34227.1 hypothetical protein FV225_17225 [Methylobacterium sp. WL93]TXN44355.1 hypothetical protein FV227_26770 [Methylobacterium sp. WL119]
MSDDFDPQDFDGARRNPHKFMKNLNQNIREVEKGYHAVVRDRTAATLALTLVAIEKYKVFDGWRQDICFKNKSKILSLTEEDFQPLVPYVVIWLSCYKTEILPSTRSKLLTIIKDLVLMEVKPEEGAEFIKVQGGFEAVYQAAKERRAAKKGLAEDVSRLAKSGMQDKADGKKARISEGVQLGRAKRSSEGASVQGHAEDPHGSQLWIDLDDDVLPDFSIHAEDDEIRLLKVRCDGKRGRKSPMIWTLLGYEILDESNSDDDDI